MDMFFRTYIPCIHPIYLVFRTPTKTCSSLMVFSYWSHLGLVWSLAWRICRKKMSRHFWTSWGHSLQAKMSKVDTFHHGIEKSCGRLGCWDWDVLSFPWKNFPFWKWRPQKMIGKKINDDYTTMEYFASVPKCVFSWNSSHNHRPWLCSC